jgi:hypothetical protein
MIFQFLTGMFMLVNFIFTPTESMAEQETKISDILKKPLIIGASVSTDYQTVSPGKKLALRYTSEHNIHVVAQRGKPGKEVLKTFTDGELKDRSVIIGIDLFFWDSFSSSPQESLKALEKIYSRAQDLKIPLVLGEIPELVPYYQKSVVVLNEKMRELCEKNKSRCKILPLNQILRKTLNDGYIVQDGKKYSIEELLPDGLHLAQPASEYLADQILRLLKE